MKLNQICASTILIVLFTLLLAIAPVGADDVVTIRLSVPANRFDVYSQLSEIFQSQNPGIKVETEYAVSTDELLVQIVAGTGPDVRAEAGGGHALLMEHDMLYNLQPFVDRDWSEDDINDVFPSVWHGIYPEGTRFGIPMYLNVPLFWFNRDMFNEAGLLDPIELEKNHDWTWDSLRESAIKLTKRNHDDDIEVIGFRTSFVSASLISRPTWIWAAGGDIFDMTSDPIRFTMNEAPAIMAMEFIQDTIWSDRTQAEASVRNNYAFDAGRLAIFDDGIHLYRQWQDNIGDSFSYGLAPRPMGPVSRGNRTSYDTWVVPITSKHPEEAWALINFLTSTEAQIAVATEQHLGPVRRSAATAFIEASPGVDMTVYLEAASTARLDPSVQIPRWSDFEQTIRPALQAIFEEGSKSPQTAMDEVAGAIQALYTNN